MLRFFRITCFTFTALFACTTHAQVDLQQLVDDASDGDTIDVPAGAYVLDDPLLISERHGLTLNIPDGTTIHLDRKDIAVLRIESSSNITINGGAYMHVRPQGVDWMFSHGGVIALTNAQNVTLTDIDITGAGNTGLTMSDCLDITVQNAAIHDNDYVAVFASTSRRLHFEGCTFENNGKRYEFYDTHEVTEAD